MESCLFCKIIRKELPSYQVYEDDAVLAFLDIHPVNPGHTLVVPKDHHKHLLDTPPEKLSALMHAVQKIAPGIMKATGAEGFNLGINNGSVAGQVIFHLHFHIMPRLVDDKHQLWHGRRGYEDGEAESIAEKIKNNL